MRLRGSAGFGFSFGFCLGLGFGYTDRGVYRQHCPSAAERETPTKTLRQTDTAAATTRRNLNAPPDETAYLGAPA